MLDLNDRIAALSPEKRALLEQQLAKTEADTAARRRILRHGLSSAPLSFSQQRLWFIDQLDPGQVTYNLPISLKLRGELDEEAIRRTLSEIVRRHEVFRTTFELANGEPVQRIHPAAEVALPVIDLQSFEPDEREREARRLISKESQLPFDLDRGPMFRASLLRLAPEEHILLLSMHHISSDAWSRGIFIRELRVLYDAFRQGRPSPLPELPVQYADFAIWQREWLRGEVLDSQILYWKDHLAGAPALLELPTDRPRPAVRTFRGEIKHARLPLTLLESLKRMSQSEGTTLFMTLLAAFYALLSRYTGQDDLVVGTPTAGRTREEVEPLIGFFVNTLSLRGDLSGDPSFRELLSRVRESALGAFAHQDLPFEKLVEELQPERSLSHSPIIQVVFQLDNAPRAAANLEGLRIANATEAGKTAKLDLQLSAVEMPNQLALVLEYSTDLFDSDRMERLLDHYRTLLEGVVSTPDAKVSALPLLTEAERHQLLVDWNDTKADYPSDLCIHELFADQAARTPDATAVVFEDQSLTYSELNARSNQLAHYLKKQGVGPETLVGLCVDRSLEMVVGMLGILKAGGAYVPLDPSYPSDRLAYMIEDAQAPVLLTQQHLAGAIPPNSSHILCLDSEWDKVASEDASAISSRCDEHNLAYVIYTSGSTGNPKGAINTHKAICNRLLWMQEAYGLNGTDRVLQKTPYSFDVSVWEFFWPLITGATLVVARPDGHRDPSYLASVIEQQKITTIHFVPSMLRAFLESDWENECASLVRVVCSGEALSRDLQERFFSRLSCDLYNLYGPTEAAVDVTHWMCHADDPLTSEVPIGRPISNIQVYVLDSQYQPVPTGVAGELYLGGVGLARGYLKRADLTAEKFVPNPFGGIGSRLYKTGDLCRWRVDGTIEYLGRLDFQVKVRGLRIELGEIESVLLSHGCVQEAVVVALGDGGETRLVGYIVVSGSSSPSESSLRDHLREKLPDYMVPSIFMFLASLPLTPSGKVNRRALPLPDGSEHQSSADYVAPNNPAEEALAKIFSNLLGVERIGVHDSFFDLGGHSMLAIRLLSEIAKVFGRKLPIRVLFQSATIASLVQELARDQETKCWTILDTVVPLQPGSERIPLCCVAAPDVNALGYVALGRHMGQDQPLFILHSRYRNNQNCPYTRKELSDMAAVNIAAMRVVLPKGPYCLGGMCDGAHIAFEMARQLREAGEEVPLLISFDAWPEENTRTRFGLWLWYLRWFGKHRRLRFKQKIVQIVGITWVALSEWALIPLRKPGPHRWASRYWPGRDFKPGQFDGRMTVLRVKKQESFRISRRDLGWGDWTSGGVDVYDVPGDHSTILRNENVAEVAAIVRRDIDRISRDGKMPGTSDEAAKVEVNL